MTNEEIKLLKNFITWQSLPFVDNLFTHEDDMIKKFDKWLSVGSNDQMTNEEAIIILKRLDNIVNNNYSEAIYMAIKSLEREPKTGHWIDIETLDSALWHECSECGETEFYATNFCPNCGADMRGDTE